MWTNKQTSYPPGTSSGTGVSTLPELAPAPVPAHVPAHVPAPVTPPTRNALETPRTHGSGTRAPAWLGPGLRIRGQITGTEDLQVECKVDGPISLGEHRLTVGPNAHVNGEITASEVIVFGEVNGNLLASERIEIKKNGSGIGDLRSEEHKSELH